MPEIHETTERAVTYRSKHSLSLRRVHTQAEIHKDDPQPGDWMVWSLDVDGGGGIYCVIFAGPSARERAIEYAEAKYHEVQLRD